jgi:hypothetical protein
MNAVKRKWAAVCWVAGLALVATSAVAAGSPPSSGPPWGKLWELFGPIVLSYSVVAGVCVVVAATRGHRGFELAGHGLVLLPMKAVWFGIVLAFVVNVYAIAGLLGSGALSAVASGTLSSASRALRK